MTTQRNTFDPQALAESSTRKTPFHIKVDHDYIDRFNRIQSYYQSETHLIKLAKQHIFKIIVEQHYNKLVASGKIIDDINPQQKEPQLEIIDNTTTTKPIVKDKPNIPEILREWRERPS